MYPQNRIRRERRSDWLLGHSTPLAAWRVSLLASFLGTLTTSKRKLLSNPGPKKTRHPLLWSIVRTAGPGLGQCSSLCRHSMPRAISAGPYMGGKAVGSSGGGAIAIRSASLTGTPCAASSCTTSGPSSTSADLSSSLPSPPCPSPTCPNTSSGTSVPSLPTSDRVLIRRILFGGDPSVASEDETLLVRLRTSPLSFLNLWINPCRSWSLMIRGWAPARGSRSYGATFPGFPSMVIAGGLSSERVTGYLSFS
jgi:hypothetical protein